MFMEVQNKSMEVQEEFAKNITSPTMIKNVELHAAPLCKNDKIV